MDRVSSESPKCECDVMVLQCLIRLRPSHIIIGILI